MNYKILLLFRQFRISKFKNTILGFETGVSIYAILQGWIPTFESGFAWRDLRKILATIITSFTLINPDLQELIDIYAKLIYIQKSFNCFFLLSH